MLKVIRRFAVLGMVPLLAACMSDAGGQSATVSQNAYTVSSVQVNLAKDAKVVGRFEDEALRKSALAKLNATVKERIKSVPGGTQDARAVVNIRRMQLRNSASRSFGGINELNGEITVFDPKGNKLKGPTAIHVSNQGAKPMTINGIPVGLLINASVHGAKENSGADVDNLISDFSNQVVGKL